MSPETRNSSCIDARELGHPVKRSMDLLLAMSEADWYGHCDSVRSVSRDDQNQPLRACRRNLQRCDDGPTVSAPFSSVSELPQGTGWSTARVI
jgi:hypothetical protein